MRAGRGYFWLFVFAVLVAGLGTHLWFPGGSVAGGGVAVTVTSQGITTMTIGSAYLWKCVAANNSGGTLTLTLQYFLNEPNGGRIQVGPGFHATSVANGKSLGATGATTGSAYTNQTGTFTFECDAVDSTGTVQGVGAASFTVLALPASFIAPQFSDVATTAGITMTHHFDKSNCMNMSGTGAGWGDYNGDGKLDLFISDYGGASHLFKNNGDGTFTDVTATAFPQDVNSSGQLIIPDATGASWADYNNDGFPDLLVLTDGDPRLYRNNGDGTFTNVAAAAGLTGFLDMMGEKLRGTTAAWGDYDSDGYLDLYIVNYMGCMMPNMSMMMMAQPDLLFHNNGNGTFTMEDSLLGGDLPGSPVAGMGFAATWFDYNNDNRPDLYVVNDFGNVVMPNVLWENGGPGANGWTFNNVSSSSGTNLRMSAMGVAIFDFNRDGNFDIAISNIGSNPLLQNNGNGTFTNVARTTGFERANVINSAGTGYTASVTWGIAPADFNNDGYEDVIVGGGQFGGNGNNSYMPDALLMNNVNGHLTGLASDGVFLDLTYLAGLGTANTAPTIAVADYLGNGWMDFVQVNFFNEPVHLYRNMSASLGNTNNWIEVKPVGACLLCAPNTAGMSNHDGIGAKLTLVSASGTQYRQIISGTSLGAGNQVYAHFGLGQDTSITSLTILWPSGITQTCTGLPINSRVQITESSTGCSFTTF